MTSTPARGSRRDILAFGRSDRVGLALVLVAVSLLSIGTWVLAPVVTWAAGGALPLPFSGEVVVPALDAAGIRYDSADYLVHIEDASTSQWVLHLLPGLGFAAVVVLGALLLLPVMRRVGAGDPFAPGAVWRLRTIGMLLLVGWPVLTVAQALADGAALAWAGIEGLPAGASLTIPVGPVVAGLAVGLVAEAFAAGSRLREDVEGLV